MKKTISTAKFILFLFIALIVPVVLHPYLQSSFVFGIFAITYLPATYLLCKKYFIPAAPLAVGIWMAGIGFATQILCIFFIGYIYGWSGFGDPDAFVDSFVFALDAASLRLALTSSVMSGVGSYMVLKFFGERVSQPIYPAQ